MKPTPTSGDPATIAPPPLRRLNSQPRKQDRAWKHAAGICRKIKACGLNFAALSVLGLAFTAPTEGALPGYQQVVLDQDPYSFHRFNEESGTTAADISGNSRNGTYDNSPTLNLPGAGGAGSDNAVGFNGSSQYMTFNANTLGSSVTNVTFETVFSTTTTATSTVFGTFNTGLTMAVNFGLNESPTGANLVGTHRFFMRNASGHHLMGSFTNADLTNGEFNHLMISVDLAAAAMNDRYKIYVNGVAQTVTMASTVIPLTATSGTFADFTNPLAVGARNLRGTIDHHLNGVIDEFAIYNNKTLTAADAAAHFAAITSVAPVPPRITAFTYDPADGSAEAAIEGAPNTRFKLVEATDLDFSTPDQDPVPLSGASVGNLFDGLYVTTDENGLATVQFNLGTGPATFIRAEEAGSITLANFDFETDGEGFTPGGDWAWGTPASDNGETNGKVIGGNGGSNGAWATGLGDGGEAPPVNGGITPSIESVLRSPGIVLTGITGARLEFAAAVDAAPGDTLEVRVLDADNTLLGTLIPFPDGFPANPVWQDLGPFDLPEDADDKTIHLEFHFIGGSNLYLGCYLDDVKITF